MNDTSNWRTVNSDAPKQLTVAELILALEKHPQDLKVEYHDYEAGPMPVTGSYVSDEGVVVIE